MKDPDKKRADWLQFRLQASNGFVALPNRLVDGKAFAALTTGASVKCLVWFWQMVMYEKREKKKGVESYIGRIDKIKDNGELSLTYQEASWRGIGQGRFSRALKELHRLGFIDIARHGRGVKGEYTKYAISTRWQKYDTQEWQTIPFPENFREGFRSDEYKAKREINSVQKCTLPAFNNARYEVPETPQNVQKRTLKTARNAKSQRAITDVSIDLLMAVRTSEELKKGLSAPDSRSKVTAAASRKQPKRSRPLDLERLRTVADRINSFVNLKHSEAVH